MKTYIRLLRGFALVLAAVVLCGCHKDDPVVEEEELLQEGSTGSVNIEASLAQPDNMQKAFLRKDSVEWEDGDEIRVNNQNYTIHRHEGGVGYFHGDANTFKSTFDGANHWFAVYPASLANQTQMIRDGNKAQICVTIPQTQYYQAVDESNPNACLKDMNFMVAYTKTMTNNSISLQFMNLCAVFKIGLKAGPTSGSEANFLKNYSSANQRVKKIVLYTSTNANAAFHGNGFVKFASNKVTDNMGINIAINMDGTVTNDNRKLILDCTKQRVKDANGRVSYNTLSNGVELNSSTYTYFYIMVPINLTDGLTDMCMEVFDQHGNMMKKTLHGITVKKNQMYKSDLQLKCQYSAKSFIDADFSVDATHTVKFTSGNLQYHCKNKTWRFAENQWSVIGTANSNIASDYNGYIDLFSYGTSGYGTNGDPCRLVNTDYPSGSITRTENDWGWHNRIHSYNESTSLGHPSHIFFTWTTGQATYMFETRNSTSYRSALGKVNGINGIILFPDQYTHPSDVTNPSYSNITFGGHNYSYSPSYDETAWNKMAALGAVFLPCGGYRGYANGDLESTTENGTTVVGKRGVVYVASYRVSHEENNAIHIIAYPKSWLYSNRNSNIEFLKSGDVPRYGRSVRLILSNY